MEILMIILGILCLGYYIFLQRSQIDFAVIWALVGVLLIFSGVVYIIILNRGLIIPVFIKWTMGCGILLIVTLFLIVEGIIISGMSQHGQQDLDYIVVLGAQVRGNRPSRALRARINTAAQYLKDNPNTIAILSGGQGPGEDITEAACMKETLVEEGIDEERLILEEKSTTTKENLIYSARLADIRDKKVGLVTQNFHVYRSLKLAKKQNYINVEGIAAPSILLYQPHFMMREAFALVKEKLVGNI